MPLPDAATREVIDRLAARVLDLLHTRDVLCSLLAEAEWRAHRAETLLRRQADHEAKRMQALITASAEHRAERRALPREPGAEG